MKRHEALHTTIFLLETVTPETVDDVYDFLIEHPDAVEHVVDGSDSIRPRIVRLLQRPYAKKLVDVLVSNIPEPKRSTVLNGIDDDVPEPPMYPLRDTVTVHGFWFLLVVLANILEEDVPDYVFSKWMGRPSCEFASVHDYYTFAMAYADSIGVTPFSIVKSIKLHTGRLDYLLTGEVYDCLFAKYFRELTTTDVSTLSVFEYPSKYVRIKVERTSPYGTSVRMKNTVYFHRRVLGYDCPREYGHDVLARVTELIAGIDNAHVEYKDRYDAYVQHRIQENADDIGVDFLTTVRNEFILENGKEHARLEEYILELTQEEPRYLTVLM